jgi:uncharacterized membrane protein
VKPDPDSLGRLEHHLGRLLILGVVVSAALLTAGLALWLAHPDGVAATSLLTTGLVVLMATPIMRVLVSFAEYLRMRDWFFVATTIVVLAELAVTVVVALTNH